ncbi:P-II family nitrogen regulator [Curvibacter sp. RS43]|uniref:P-II family nitrogen regulator n=1 Tax=Curvibacter microcysteis TaxID=3026419 RepID=A0ABT5M980_9BURK|nr:MULTISPECIES: P-II family nitrogen regulator [unclassified Curvibacter]MDD0812180.1 P-II family nitrogen regulator [Curvibacter sp. RS43]MDD0813144.1 P-II family nitrogen regulator [Curvibacter sp. HBC28]
MREIRAIVRPSRLNKLRDALRAIPNFPGVTIFKAEGFTAPAAVEKRTVKEELTDFTPKLMVCVLCDVAMVDTIRDAIISACHTGQIGDGLVWVVDLESTHRIRDHSPI